MHAYKLTSFTKFDSSISSQEDFVYLAQKRADHVVGVERQKYVQNFGGKPLQKWPLGTPGRNWYSNIKVDFKEMDCEDGKLKVKLSLCLIT
jgi:hypothetical protein